MRKEIIFAIIAGALFGLVIAIGIWRARSAINPQDTTNGVVENKSNNSTEQVDYGLTVASPSSNDVIDSTPTQISGITGPNLWVMISSETYDYMVQADNEGEFRQEVELEPGVNEIIVSSYSFGGENPNKQKLVVVYSSQFGQETTQENEE